MIRRNQKNSIMANAVLEGPNGQERRELGTVHRSVTAGRRGGSKMGTPIGGLEKRSQPFRHGEGLKRVE